MTGMEATKTMEAYILLNSHISYPGTNRET